MSSFSLFNPEQRNRSAGRERRGETNRMKKCLWRRSADSALPPACGGDGDGLLKPSWRPRSVTGSREPSRRRRGGGEAKEEETERNERELVKERSYLSDMLPFHLEVFFVVRDVGSLGPAVSFTLLLWCWELLLLLPASFFCFGSLFSCLNAFAPV